MEKWTRLLIIIATVLLMLTFLGVGIHIATYIHHTLLLFALGGLVAYALSPLVERLSRTRLSRPLSVAAVFVCLLALFGLGAWFLEGKLVGQVQDIQQKFPDYKQKALERAGALDQKLAARHVHFSLTDAIQHPPAEFRTLGERAGKDALPLLRRSFTDVAEAVIVLLIALYFLIFAPDMREKFNGMLPTDLARRADLWETDVSRILGGFVSGQLIIALIMGAAAALGCLAIGIGPWLIIGLFVVVAALIPVFGPYIGAVPAVILALISHTHFHPVVAAVIVLLWFVLINEVGGKVLYPKLVGAALGLHEVVVLFVLFAGLEINGIVGTLFAAPVAALAIVTMVHLYRLWSDLPDDLISNANRRESRQAGKITPKPAAPEPETQADDRKARVPREPRVT
jgi:predicted PurR-regulated permease PerM